MANFSAIRTVSETLKTLLDDRMSTQLNKSVTLAPPDVTVDGVTGYRLNLFLYHIAEDPHLKNQDIPGHGHPAAFGRPPLSLVLHYLMTAYADNPSSPDGDLAAQEVLGDAMTVLHDYPIITPELLGSAHALEHEFERIKITPQPLNLEDLSKIWTALPQANFRRSVAYEVSAIQLESHLVRHLARPVKTRRLHSTQLHQPVITAIYRTPAVGEPVGDFRARLLESITLQGENFAASRTWIKLGDLEPIRVFATANGSFQIAVPDTQYPIDADHPTVRDIDPSNRLWPGPQRVTVLTEQKTEVVQGGLDAKGTVISDTQVLHSNEAVFMLVPEISSVSLVLDTNGKPLVQVEGKRLYQAGLKTLVLVGKLAIDVHANGQTDTVVQASLTDTHTGTVRLPLGTYPVAVRVNGAQNTEEFEVTL